MTTRGFQSNRVREQRQVRGWSQIELAERSGISRAGISAIETCRLTPSVVAALSLAQVFECSVEQLFGGELSPGEPNVAWAWASPSFPRRYWAAEVGGQIYAYPVELSEVNWQPHQGVADAANANFSIGSETSQTLVMACCDLAAELLAREYASQTGLQLLVLSRSSRDALDLLQQGLIHVAGIHLSNTEDVGGNAAVLRSKQMESEIRLLHVSQWQLGIAMRSDRKIKSVRRALAEKLQWVGRTEGAGVRRCQNQLLGDRRPPAKTSRTHRDVATAIRDGWADVGVTMQLACDEAQLDFLPVCEDRYDLCFLKSLAHDPRIIALIQTIRSAAYRTKMAELPGYRIKDCGEVETVVPD